MRAITENPGASGFAPQSLDRLPNGPADPGPNEFIPHPSDCPIHVRRLGFKGRRRVRPQAASKLGLTYSSKQFMPPGTFVNVQIPVRGETERFRGEIVLVRETSCGFEIGIWLESDADAARARIVEQICHIESYWSQEHRDGRPMSRQHAAQEWISKFAASFPAF